jgi:predicted RecB family endonuclease
MVKFGDIDPFVLALTDPTGYRLSREHAIPGDGVVDLVAENDRERVAIEVETGRSDIAENTRKLAGAPFDRIVLVATSPAAVEACQRALARTGDERLIPTELISWLDL